MTSYSSLTTYKLYYNVPKNDVLNQTAFPPAILTVRGSMGVSWCQGSGYVARRAAMANNILIVRGRALFDDVDWR